jgi:hypothetical protein
MFPCQCLSLCVRCSVIKLARAVLRTSLTYIHFQWASHCLSKFRQCSLDDNIFIGQKIIRSYEVFDDIFTTRVTNFIARYEQKCFSLILHQIDCNTAMDKGNGFFWRLAINHLENWYWLKFLIMFKFRRGVFQLLQFTLLNTENVFTWLMTPNEYRLQTWIAFLIPTLRTSYYVLLQNIVTQYRIVLDIRETKYMLLNLWIELENCDFHEIWY